MKKIIIILGLSCIVFSCKKEKINGNKEELNTFKDEYFEDNLIYNKNNFKDQTKTLTLENGANIVTNKKTQFLGDIYYTATVLPLKYYIIKNLKITNKDSINYYLKKLKGEKVVQFEFQHKQRKDLLLKEFTNVSYEESVKYMAFKIKNDFKAITVTGDTLKCKGVLFERNFKLAPFKRVLAYFKNDEDFNAFKLIYDDQLFENGIIKFNLTN